MAQFFVYALTSSNINRSSILFHCQNQEKISKNAITKDPTTPQVCRYPATVLSQGPIARTTATNVFKVVNDAKRDETRRTLVRSRILIPTTAPARWVVSKYPLLS